MNNDCQNVALSLRDRKAARALQLNISTDVIEPMRRTSTFGIPVAERQGYGEAAGE